VGEDITMKFGGASNRVKLTFEYSLEKKKYIVSDDDKAVFLRYDIDINQFMQSTKRIEGDVRLRPFDLK
jgi:hypothetical protein